MPAEFQWKVRVYYEDTDAGGVVFYANYLRYMERARTEWLRSIGFEHQRLNEEFGVLFAVRKLSIEYNRPALLDDLVTVTSTLVSRRGASMTFQQTISNEQQELLCQAEVKVACLKSGSLRPSPMPDVLITELLDVD